MGTAVPAAGLDGTVTFLGQWHSGLRELSMHPTWRFEVFKGGALPHIRIPEDADGSSYVSLASMDAEELRDLRARPGADKIVLAAPAAALYLDYCVGTEPLFLLKAPPGQGGFTPADLAGACAYAYQWCYAMEDAHLGGRRPSHPMLMNRGASYGPFRISMHDLGDLVLHSFDVMGSLPAPGAGADVDGDAPVTLLLRPGIDS